MRQNEMHRDSKVLRIQINNLCFKKTNNLDFPKWHMVVASCLSNIYTFSRLFIHRWRWLPCRVPTSTSGAVGSVSCLWSALPHADQWNRTGFLPIIRRLCSSLITNNKSDSDIRSPSMPSSSATQLILKLKVYLSGRYAQISAEPTFDLKTLSF